VEEAHPRELLRDGAAALHDAAGAHIGDEGAGKADRVQPKVMVKTAVLDGEHRLRQVFRQIGHGQRPAVEVAQGGQHRAVFREHGDCRLPGGCERLIDVRQVGGVPRDEPPQQNNAPNPRYDRPLEQNGGPPVRWFVRHRCRRARANDPIILRMANLCEHAASLKPNEALNARGSAQLL